MAIEDPSALTVVKLKAELSNRNLPVKGKKDELVARLKEALEAEKNDGSEAVVEAIQAEEAKVDQPTEETAQITPEKVEPDVVEKEAIAEVEEKAVEEIKEKAAEKIEEEYVMVEKPIGAMEEQAKEAPKEEKSVEMAKETVMKEVTPVEPQERIKPVGSMETDKNAKRRRSLEPTEHTDEKRTKLDISEAPENKVETSALYVKGFIRPLIIRSVQELFGKYGDVKRFWMDSIKTHCYVIYENNEQAKNAYDNVNGIVFPQDTGKTLTVGTLTSEQVEQLIEHEQYAAEKRLRVDWEPLVEKVKNGEKLPSSPNSDNLRKTRSIGMGQITKQLAQAAIPSVPQPRQSAVESPPPPPQRSENTLDYLFRKTEALPHLYYLPNTDEVANLKLKEIQKL